MIAGHAWYQWKGAVALDSARRAIDRVDADVLERLGKTDRIFQIPNAALAVHDRATEKDRTIARPGGAHGVGALEGKPHPPRAVTAIGIGALVCDRRQELMNEIAVSAVDLADVVSGLRGSLGRLRP